MVRDDRLGIKSAWVFYIIIALMYSVVFLITLHSFFNPGNLAFVAYWTVLAIFYYVRERRWKPMNERRQMAAVWGFASRVPLAQPHPLPNVGALPLPFTITIRPAWPKFLLGLGFLSGGLLLGLASFFPVIAQGGTSYSHPILGFLVLFITLFVSAMILLWLRPQQILVTQEGLTVRHVTGGLHGTDSIRWNEARLFAIRDGKPGIPATRYELSSPFTVVQWTRVRHNQRWALHRPAIPFAEYDAQMEALIALTSGVTGLPLYDVR